MNKSMNTETISVIVPIYNTSAYLPRCLDSIVNQNYTNLEILLVNDGSTDNSGCICDEYAKKDTRIRVFHKENGGVASARNTGLTHRTGFYTGFVDSDDWIEPDMYEVLHRKLEDNSESSVSIANYFKDSMNTAIPMINKEPLPNQPLLTKDLILCALKRDSYMGVCAYLWNKLFVSASISHIICDESILLGEDVLLFFEFVIRGGGKGVYVDKPLYHYFQRTDSLANATSLKNRLHIMTVYKKIETLLKEYGYSDIAFWARGFYCYHASMAAEKAVTAGDGKTLALMQTEIKAYLSDYIETNKHFPEKAERMYCLLDIDLKNRSVPV